MEDIFENEEKNEAEATVGEEERTVLTDAPETENEPETENAPDAEEVPAEEAKRETPPYFNNLPPRRPTPRDGEGQSGPDGFAAPRYGEWQSGAPVQPAPPRDGMTPPPGYQGQRPFYGVPDVNRGGISYAPAERAKKKERKKRGMSRGAAIVLVAVCVLLSFGAGFLGAYVAGISGSVQTVGTPSEGKETTVIRRVETAESGKTAPVDDSGTYTAVVNKVGDAVVEIGTEYKTTGWFQLVQSGGGSGVIISEDGYIVTNNHVICGSDEKTIADSITVTTRAGDEYKATVVGRDADLDIAVIKIDADGLTAAAFGDSDALKVGDEVIAIGNPLGVLGGTVTNGIISALAREITIEGKKMTLLQTNAAINFGNSGGGLFNMKGEIVGIVNGKSAGTGIEGLAFAIPSNDVYEMTTELIESGRGGAVTGNTIVGITLCDVDSAYKAQELGVRSLGVYIVEVKEGYNDKVLKANDRILSINGDEVTCGDDVINVIKASKPGDKLTFTLYRDGKITDAEVTCFEAESE